MLSYCLSHPQLRMGKIFGNFDKKKEKRKKVKKGKKIRQGWKLLEGGMVIVPQEAGVR